MRVQRLHRWDVTPEKASAIQTTLRDRVVVRGGVPGVRHVAGADVSYDKHSDAIHAAVVVLSYPGLITVETAGASGKARFPYIPGYLSFREIPILLRALRRIRTRPDLLLCDGQGIAHPRGFGLASHLGVILDLPTVGCAKTRLVGEHTPPGLEGGSSTPLMHDGRRIGAVVRTRTGVNPIFVSPGHKIDIRGAVRWSLACCDGLRIPEPTRRAHHEVNRIRREANAGAGL